MTLETILNCTVILCLAVIMLASKVKAKDIMLVIALVPGSHRKTITLCLSIHRALMLFFLVCYLVVMYAIMFDFSMIGESLVSVIFLLGAIFVLIGVSFSLGFYLKYSLRYEDCCQFVRNAKRLASRMER